MAVRKTAKGAALKRWFNEKWTDQHGRECGSSKTKGIKKCRPSKKVSSKTPKTWSQVDKNKEVAKKRKVGMGNRTSKANYGGEPIYNNVGMRVPGMYKKGGSSPAWTRKEGKNKSGGLNEAGRKSYERANPGSNLKAPSKKVGNKRRASFCARMKGMKKKLTSSKTANDPNSRINKSLRAWNC